MEGREQSAGRLQSPQTQKGGSKIHHVWDVMDSLYFPASKIGDFQPIYAKILRVLDLQTQQRLKIEFPHSTLTRRFAVILVLQGFCWRCGVFFGEMLAGGSKLVDSQPTLLHPNISQQHPCPTPPRWAGSPPAAVARRHDPWLLPGMSCQGWPHLKLPKFFW